MSFETDMIAKYGAVFSGRVWWDEIPDGMTADQRAAPFAILQQVGGTTRQYIDDKEQPEFLTARVQVVVWGARRVDVSAKLRDFDAAVKDSNTATWYARSMGEQVGDSNEVLKLRGSRQDFSFTFPNPHYPGP
jgi:hypothetical protein